ncbi:hypothetical protein [Providencia sp. PROV257]|uniref:hypothetical protein n=1 Tax=Providencia sp. PROV257 TaxID=2949945 RepID=UPI00234A3498|nr:hypothetical protein [Providencia sp. PROV257]
MNRYNYSIEYFAKYPDPVSFAKFMLKNEVDNNQLFEFTRIHLIENIPFILKNAPLSYQMIRRKLANRLNIDSCSIFIIGSSNIGFSMATNPKYGTIYTKDSDIDVSIVSDVLFEKSITFFNKWKDEYEGKNISPKPPEKKFWDDNLITVSNNIKRGFIDSYKIPNLYDDYNVNQSLYLFSKDLANALETTDKFNVSARIYKDWKSFEKQYLINLNYCKQSLNNNYLELLKTKLTT